MRMMKKRVVDLVVVAAAVLFLVAGAFLVRSWSGPNSVAYIRTAGTVGCTGGCGGCSTEAGKALTCIPGIAWVHNEKRDGLTLVAFDSTSIRPHDLLSAFRKHGVDSRMEKIVTLEQYYRNCRASRNAPDCGTSCPGGCRKEKQ
jgi:hypothetical protein